MSLLKIVQLRKTFGDLVAVDDVGFEVASGEIFGLLGPNGAGKSTSMMMLAGLLDADSGSIFLDGLPLRRSDRLQRRSLGVVPQELSIYPNLTARENLYFFGRLYGVQRSTLRKRVASVLEQIGLSDRADDLTGTFSGGMKRRLNFGAALLHEPRLLILDEPTVGVDPQSRAHLLECIRRLRADGVSVIYVSHYMDEVEAICERIAIIDHGRMVACDRIDTLLSQTDSSLILKFASLPETLVTEIGRRFASRAKIRPAGEGQRFPAIILSNFEGKESAKEAQKSGSLQELLSSVLSVVETSGAKLLSVESEEPNLERLFLQLTGHRLRD